MHSTLKCSKGRRNAKVAKEPEILDEGRGSFENAPKSPSTQGQLHGDSTIPILVENQLAVQVNEANTSKKVIRTRVAGKKMVVVSRAYINSVLNGETTNLSKKVDKTHSEHKTSDVKAEVVNTVEACNFDASDSLRPSAPESTTKKRQLKRKATNGLTSQNIQKSKNHSVSQSVVTNVSQKLASHRKEPTKSVKVFTATTVGGLNSANTFKPLGDSEEQMHPRHASITHEHELLAPRPRLADQWSISHVNKLGGTPVLRLIRAPRAVSPDITSLPVTHTYKPQKVVKPNSQLASKYSKALPASTTINTMNENSNETKQQGDSMTVPQPAIITEGHKLTEGVAIKAEPKKKKSIYKIWYPNLVEQQKLYQEMAHFVEIDNIKKAPVDTHVWRMINATDVVLQKFTPIDMNGRVFHKATSQLQVLETKDRAFFIKYQPVIVVIVHDTDAVKIIQYFNVDRVQSYLEKMLKTPSLFWPFKIVIQAIITEFLTWPPGFIESRVLADSEKCSEYFKSAWDIIESAISDRVKVLSTETKLVPGLIVQFLNRPFIKFSTPRKVLDKNCMGCTFHPRKAVYRVQFHGRPYDQYSFDDLPGDDIPPMDLYFCTSCTPYFRTIDKLLNHKWCLYRAFRNRITDYIGELGPAESMERGNLIQVILNDHEYIFQCFVELQMQLAEADNHIEKLKNVN